MEWYRICNVNKILYRICHFSSMYHALTVSHTCLYCSATEPVIPVPSVLRRCWLGSRKGIRPVKNLEWWGTGMVVCLQRGADLHTAQLMPLPLTVSCFSKIQIGFTCLVPAHPRSPGQRAVKRVCAYHALTKAY